MESLNKFHAIDIIIIFLRIIIQKIDINTKEIRTLVQGDRNINSFSISRNYERIAFEVSHVSFPSDIFWCNGDGSQEERITQTGRKRLCRSGR